jgi:hypothetical protein
VPFLWLTWENVGPSPIAKRSSRLLTNRPYKQSYHKEGLVSLEPELHPSIFLLEYIGCRHESTSFGCKPGLPVQS